MLFSGDHVMAWSTSIVAPPDGAMSDYMASLHKLAQRAEPIYLPGHGGAVRDAPRFVAAYIRHRQAREASILHRLGKGESRHPDHRARDLYRARSAAGAARPACRCWRIWKTWSARGVVATEGPRGLDRSGVYPLGGWILLASVCGFLRLLGSGFCGRLLLGFCARRVVDIVRAALRMRAALVPKSWRP